MPTENALLGSFDTCDDPQGAEGNGFDAIPVNLILTRPLVGHDWLTGKKELACVLGPFSGGADTQRRPCHKQPCRKILCGFWGGAPNTHMSAHHGPAKVFLHA